MDNLLNFYNWCLKECNEERELLNWFLDWNKYDKYIDDIYFDIFLDDKLNFN